jgi:hypothetical protein
VRRPRIVFRSAEPTRYAFHILHILPEPLPRRLLYLLISVWTSSTALLQLFITTRSSVLRGSPLRRRSELGFSTLPKTDDKAIFKESSSLQISWYSKGPSYMAATIDLTRLIAARMSPAPSQKTYSRREPTPLTIRRLKLQLELNRSFSSRSWSLP